MTSSTKKCRMLSDGYLVTGECRLSFPNLFAPGKLSGKYEVTLLFPPDADMEPIRKLADEALIEKFGKKPPRMKFDAIRLGEDCLTAAGDPKYPDMDGWFVLRASTKNAPAVVDRLTKPITPEVGHDGEPRNPEEVYPGVWASVILNAYAWSHPQSGKGVSFGLSAVQILRDDEPLVNAGKSLASAFEVHGEDTGGDKERAF